MSTSRVWRRACPAAADAPLSDGGGVDGVQKKTHTAQNKNQPTLSWWKEYSHRKNDQEDDMVADSLLYDERCHLPRTAPGPRFDEQHVWHAELEGGGEGAAAAAAANGSSEAAAPNAHVNGNGTTANGTHAS